MLRGGVGSMCRDMCCVICDGLRCAQMAAERLRSDRMAMEVEDELSSLSEQLYHEMLEKEAWRQQEAQRLAAWEEEQRQKDELEAARRQERMAELQAKKEQLAALRRKKMKTGGVGGQVGEAVVSAEDRAKDVATARAEALKLGKQMRIQNKAKFVSKKRSAGGASSVMNTPNKPDPPSVDGNVVKHDSSGCALATPPVPAVEVPPQEALAIQSMTTETELHQKLKSSMDEKRQLRLEVMGLRGGAGAGSANDAGGEEVAQLLRRVEEISAVERLIEARMEQVVYKKKDGEQAGGTENPVRGNMEGASGLGIAEEPTGRRRSSSTTTPLRGLGLGASGGAGRFAETGRGESFVGSAQDDLYSSIERSLQEASELLGKATVVGALSGAKPGEEMGLVMRRAGLLKMQMVDFLVKMEKNDDVIGYTDKLTKAMHRLSAFLESHQTSPLPKTLSRHNSLNPEILSQLPDQNSVVPRAGAPTPPRSKPPPRTGSTEDVLRRTASGSSAKGLASPASATAPLSLPMDFASLAVAPPTPHAPVAAGIAMPHGQAAPPTTVERTSATADPAPDSGRADGFRSPSSRRSPRERLAEKHGLSLSTPPTGKEEPYVVSPRTRLSPRARPNDTMKKSVDGPASTSKLHDNTSGRSTSRSSGGGTDRDESAVLSSFLAVEAAGGDKSGQQQAARRGSRSGIMQSASAKKPQTGNEQERGPEVRTIDSVEPKRQALAGSVVTSSMEQKVVGQSQQERKSGWAVVSSERVVTSVTVEMQGQGGEGEVTPPDEGTPVVKAPPSSASLAQGEGEGEGGGADIDTIAGRLFEDPLEGGSADQWEEEMGEHEEEAKEGEDEEVVDFDSIPGWHECVHTSMATAAHHAAFYGFTAVLETLSKYFDVFAVDKNGRTPLFYASLRNNLDCVLLLVALGEWVAYDT